VTASSTTPRFLGLRIVSDAVVVPRRVFGDKSAGAGVLRAEAGGLVPVADTGVRRRGREYVVAPRADDVGSLRRVEAAVYGGFLFEHYGHFLLESLGRLWFDGVDGRVPTVWIAATGNHFTPWMHELAERVGVRGEMILLDGTEGALEVGRLLVPDQGFEVQRYLHPWFAARLARTPARPEPGLRVWLSRSALGERAGVADEPQIESRLAAEGWQIARLEQMTIADQVSLLSRASHIAGVEGSALHTLLLVSGFEGTVDVLSRHESSNFEVIARATGWDQVRHPMPGGRPEVWHRPSGARDVRWTGIDVGAAVDRIVESSGRRTSRAGRLSRLRRALATRRGS
jgi:hypothetical protein